MWPKAETLAQAESPLPTVSLLVGFFVAGLLASIVYSAQTSQLRARELIAANRQLKKEIAEREEMEEQLREAQKMEAVGRLAGGVAHDFNNLLMVIRGHGHAVARARMPADLNAQESENILKSTERASSLTRQLLAFSRKQVLQSRVLDLNALVARSRNCCRRCLARTFAAA